MKILLISIGSRGDMEPFLALGEYLLKKGHQVAAAFPQQFKQIVLETGLEFYPMSHKFLDLLHSDIGKKAIGAGSSWKKFPAYLKLAKKYGPINKELIQDQRQAINEFQPDLVLYHPKALYGALWGMEHPGKSTTISPVPLICHPHKDYPHIGFNKSHGSLLDKLSYEIALFGLIMVLKRSIKTHNLKNKKYRDIKKYILSNKWIYTVSPSLFPKPSYWPQNTHVLGFHERNKIVNWTAPPDLKDFIRNHSKIIFLSFGSMTNSNPSQKTNLILDSLEKHNIPAIINTFSGGLIKPKSYNKDLFYFTNDIPYDWIFPQVHSVIHHGGSGTTHMAIKYACSTMIIPHIVDQFFWRRTTAELKLGPKGPSIDKLSSENISEKILDLFQNETYKQNAQNLSKNLREEEKLISKIHEIITDKKTMG